MGPQLTKCNICVILLKRHKVRCYRRTQMLQRTKIFFPRKSIAGKFIHLEKCEIYKNPIIAFFDHFDIRKVESKMPMGD